MSSLYKRHSLVWLNQSGWHQVRAATVTLAPVLHQLPGRWQEHDWPAVLRRQDADAGDDELCIGIALPPDADGNKVRLPLRVNRSGVREVRAPLELGAVLTHAPAAWRAALQALQYQALVQALDLRVYGSLALQALTGLVYLRPGSDIDLLLTPGNRFQLERGMRLLREYAEVLPLDGEVLFPAGGVAWKEWQQAASDPAARVLLKRRQDVVLQSVVQIVAGTAALDVMNVQDVQELACPQ